MFKQVSGQAIEICEIIQERGKEAWLVGGAVRDMLMGKQPHDWDVATNASPDQIMRWFTKVIPTGIKHGTVTVILGDESFEVTTYRGESGYSDGRHPDMTYPVHTIEEDLSRRDFTVNAIAWDPVRDKFCDPFGGCADILLKRIRCVGSARDRFREDGLRCLRACRFAATLGFEFVDGLTCDIYDNRASYEKVSAERIVQEWKKALKADKPSTAFSLMIQTGLLGITVPEFSDHPGCEQNAWHAYDCWDHTLAVLDSCPKDEIVQLAALFHDVAKPRTRRISERTGRYNFHGHEDVGADMTRDIMTRLKFSTAEIEQVTNLVRHHLLPREDLSGAALRRWVRKVGPENVDRLLALAQAYQDGKGPAELQAPADFVVRFGEKVREATGDQKFANKTTDLAINGGDVMGLLGIGPGPKIGEVLTAALEHVTQYPEMNTRENLIKFMAGVV